MTTDSGLHLLGTKPIHFVAPLFVNLIGVVIGSTTIIAFAVGVLTVLLFGNMRTVNTYRWRTDHDETKDCDETDLER